MSSNLRAKSFPVITVLTILLTSAIGVWAHPPGEGHDDGHAGHDHASHDHSAQAVSRGAHNGQMSAAGGYNFEVFYAPKETRVYVYDARRQPVSARGVRGEVIMRVRGNDKEYRYPLNYARTGGEDYLAAGVDVSRVRDGDMQVTFDLHGLPSRSTPAARFAQTFALSRRPLAVTVARLTQADQAGVARQRICPVMDVALGEDGPPIKLLVGRQPLYVCCDDCVAEVRKNPELYVAKGSAGATPQRAGTRPPPISVSYATAADAAAIRAQGRCVVMTDQQLGGHGKPINITIDGQSLFVCCKGCIRKVRQNPKLYLAKARELRRGR